MIIEPSGRVVVFGATGFTGELIVRRLIDRGVKPVAAGRREQALENLRDRVGPIETRVADADRPDTVRALVARGDVLVSSVGPFSRHGFPALEAAVDAGAHYLDPAGEGQFVRAVLDHYGPEAERTGSALLPAFGFESVPGNLAAATALRAADRPATSVEVLYVCDPRVSSGGTRASAADVMLERAFAWQNGGLADRRVGARNRRFDVDGRQIRGLSIPSSEHLVLPREFPSLQDVEVYLGGFGALARPLQFAAAANSWFGKVPVLRRAASGVNRLVFPSSSGGPDERLRANTTTYAIANAYRDGELLSHAAFAGPDPYLFTADVLAWAVENILAGRLSRPGGLGPCAAFGTAALAEAAPELGLRRLTS